MCNQQSVSCEEYSKECGIQLPLFSETRKEIMASETICIVPDLLSKDLPLDPAILPWCKDTHTHELRL